MTQRLPLLPAGDMDVAVIHASKAVDMNHRLVMLARRGWFSRLR
jgi:hypothetical protein